MHPQPTSLSHGLCRQGVYQRGCIRGVGGPCVRCNVPPCLCGRCSAAERASPARVAGPVPVHSRGCSWTRAPAAAASPTAVPSEALTSTLTSTQAPTADCDAGVLSPSSASLCFRHILTQRPEGTRIYLSRIGSAPLCKTRADVLPIDKRTPRTKDRILSSSSPSTEYVYQGMIGCCVHSAVLVHVVASVACWRVLHVHKSAC